MNNLSRLIREYEKSCDMIFQYENYEPDQFELERGNWRELARERANSFREIRLILKEQIIRTLDGED